MESSVGIPIVGMLLQLFNLVRTGKIKRDDRLDTAIQAVGRAVGGTRRYLSEVEQSGIRNEQEEARLSNLWGDAVAPLRHFDSDLAERCRLKGCYWRDPFNWSPAQIDEARIGFDQVQKECDAFVAKNV